MPLGLLTYIKTYIYMTKDTSGTVSSKKLSHMIDLISNKSTVRKTVMYL